MNSNNEKFKILISVILIAVFYFVPSTLYLFFIVSYFSILSFSNKNINLPLFIISMPLTDIVTNMNTRFPIEIKLNLLFFIVLVTSEIYFNAKTSNSFRLKKDVLIFVVLFLTYNIFSILINLQFLKNSFPYYGTLFMNLILLLIISSKLYFNSDNSLTIHSLFLSGIIILIISLSSIIENLGQPLNRLRLDSSVRLITNYIGPSIMINYFYLINKYFKSKGKKLFYLFLLILQIFVILATGSRGTLVAVLGSILIVTIAFNNFSFKKSILSLSITVLILFLLDKAGFADVISRIINFTNDSRTKIWANAFKQVPFSRLIFGLGLNRFQELSKLGGLVTKYGNTPFYAHSIYIDTLFSNGIFGLLFLIGFIINIFTCSLNSLKKLSFIILLYNLLLHITHGQLSSSMFWILLSISIGTLNQYEEANLYE